MAVSKITTPPTQKEAIDKINEIIDNMGGTITVDQTYDGTSVNPQSGVAIAGAKFIQNTANISFALGIGGINSPATASGMSSIAIGGGALANTLNTMAIGRGAEARSQGAIQLGYGANYSKSLSVGFYDSSTPANYKLLDGTTGKIPNDRLNLDQTFDGTSTNAQSGVAVQGAIDTRANLDLNNISNTAKSSVVSWSLPSSTKTALTAAFGTYTAPADGWVLAYGRATANTSYIYAENETTGFQLQIWISAANNGSYTFVPVNKGDTFSIGGYNNTLAANTFYYANGNESEAS